MKREEVYKILDGERDYQDKRWEHLIPDKNKSIADWLIYMELHLDKAKQSVYEFDYEEALEEIRKTTALGVCCMEYNDCPPR